jgi:hypothetical protein
MLKSIKFPSEGEIIRIPGIPHIDWKFIHPFVRPDADPEPIKEPDPVDFTF